MQPVGWGPSIRLLQHRQQLLQGPQEQVRHRNHCHMQLYNQDCSSRPRRRGACSHRYLPCALLFPLRVLRRPKKKRTEEPAATSHLPPAISASHTAKPPHPPGKVLAQKTADQQLLAQAAQRVQRRHRESNVRRNRPRRRRTKQRRRRRKGRKRGRRRRRKRRKRGRRRRRKRKRGGRRRRRKRRRRDGRKQRRRKQKR